MNQTKLYLHSYTENLSEIAAVIMFFYFDMVITQTGLKFK